MRVGFLTRKYADGYVGGDRILDDKTRKVLSAFVQLSTLELPRDRTSASIARAISRCGHPAHQIYASQENSALIADFACKNDAIVISHEGLIEPFLTASVDTPACILLHNALSCAEGNLGVRGLFRGGAQRLERRAFSRKATSAIVLSRRERLILEAEGWKNVASCPPGIREAFKSPIRRFDEEKIVVNGSTDWGLKRRDLEVFLKGFYSSQLPIELTSENEICDDGTLRVAVVTDRFKTGFKLKAADLLCRNTALISFLDISDDFPLDCAPRMSMRVIRSPKDIPRAIQELHENFDAVVQEIETIKRAMMESMSWQRLGEVILLSIKQVMMDE